MSKPVTLGIATIAILMAASGYSAGTLVEQNKQRVYYKTTAIEYGCAAYDRKTGQWNWEKPLLTRSDMEEQAEDTSAKAIPSLSGQSQGIKLPAQKPKKN